VPGGAGAPCPLVWCRPIAQAAVEAVVEAAVDAVDAAVETIQALVGRRWALAW